MAHADLPHKETNNTLNLHPDLLGRPQLCSVHMDFAVWLVDRNNSVSSRDY